jgi:hypothetical protein
VNRSNAGFPRAVVYGLLRALPGDRAFLSPSSARRGCVFANLNASVGASGPHDFAVRELQAFVLRQSPRPPHPTATFVTIASRPSYRVRRGERVALICPTTEAECFCAMGWTGF